MSRRNQVRMTDAEVAAYLTEPHLCRIGTIGPGGTIHMVAMNYGFLVIRPRSGAIAELRKSATSNAIGPSA